MVQNRNKLITLFIGNISNAIVHEILEKAIDKDEIREKYNKELKTSYDISKYYRNMINPIDKPLPVVDVIFIKKKITNNVRNELLLRINRGYKNINLDLIEEITEKFLKELKVR